MRQVFAVAGGHLEVMALQPLRLDLELGYLAQPQKARLGASELWSSFPR